MTETIKHKRGWLHATDQGSGEFWTVDVAELAAKKVGDIVTLTWDQIDLIYPSTALEPAVDAHRAVLDYCIHLWGAENDMGVLVYVDFVEGTTSSAKGARFAIRATHHPKDIFGARGTPLRDAIDLITRLDLNSFGCQIADLVDEQHAMGFEHAVTYKGSVEAAEAALQAAGRDRWLPRSCMHGDQYIAIEARDLIDTAPGWTWYAYALIARPYALVTGKKLHPDDPDWQKGKTTQIGSSIAAAQRAGCAVIVTSSR